LASNLLVIGTKGCIKFGDLLLFDNLCLVSRFMCFYMSSDLIGFSEFIRYSELGPDGDAVPSLI
jgi:hypothetical protein